MNYDSQNYRIMLVDDPDFNNPNFSPIDYINAVFPNEQSLSDIDLFFGKVQSSIQKIDEDIQREIRFQSRQRHHATNALHASQVSISGLFDKIRDIKTKAEQSEAMVTEICKDIKTLDHAKTHLTTSIKTLRRLQMLASAVDQLWSRVNTRQYREVGNLLGAVNQLSPGFTEFKTIPKIESINLAIETIKTDLEQQCKEEFTKYESQQYTGMSGSGPTLLSDVCFAVTALGPAVQAGFLKWFVDGQLQDYKEAFQKNSELAKLGGVERRYLWLNREQRYFEDTYSNVFPKEWKVLQTIAIEFCIYTRLAIAENLETTKDTLDVNALVGALKKTVDFEKGLCTKFQESDRPIVPDDEVPIETGFLDDEPFEGAISKYSTAAIKLKWEKHKELQEKEKQAKLVKLQKFSPHPALQFKGMISTCFDPYMDQYIRQEDKNMKELLDRLVKEETWGVVVGEEGNKVLSSSTDLIFYFNEARKRCAPLTKGQPLYDLFNLFKKYMNAYATILSNKIGEDHPANLPPKPFSDADELAICLVVNTSDYCSKTTAQISETIIHIIDQKFKEKVDLSQEAEVFSVVTSKALKALANSLEAKLEPALQTMSKIRWGEVEQVGEQSAYVSQIDAILKATLPQYKDFFSPAHFQYVCDSFVSSFVSRGVIQHIYKCKRISNVGAHQLLLDFATVKSTLLHVVGQPPTRYVKLVNKEIGRVEAILKLLGLQNEGIVTGYYTLIPNGSDADLQRILALKGTKSEERKELLQRHHDHNILSHLLTPISPPSSRSSSPTTILSASGPISAGSSPSLPSLSMPNLPNLPNLPTITFTNAPTVSAQASATASALKVSLKNFLPDLLERYNK